MRNVIVMLGCVAALSAAAGGATYHYNFHFAKDDASTFDQDREACIRDTSTKSLPNGGRAGVYTMSERGNQTFRHNPAAFQQCMIAKGYRPDPNGPLKATLWTSN